MWHYFYVFLCIVELTKAALVSANAEIILEELERGMTCKYKCSIHKLKTNAIKCFKVINDDLHNISDHLAVSATLQLQKINPWAEKAANSQHAGDGQKCCNEVQTSITCHGQV